MLLGKREGKMEGLKKKKKKKKVKVKRCTAVPHTLALCCVLCCMQQLGGNLDRISNQSCALEGLELDQVSRCVVSCLAT